MLVITGEDAQALQSTAMAVEKDLRTIGGLGSIASTASLVRPEIAVRPDFAKAADLGVTSAAISDTLRVALLGDYDAALPKLNLSQRQVPIVVKLEADARKDLGVLERLVVPGSHGPVMPGQVASIDVASGPAVIDRYDRQRNINFEIELSGMPLGDVTLAVQKLPALQSLPPGVKVVEVGDAEVMGELFASFGLAMTIGVLCIYIVLVEYAIEVRRGHPAKDGNPAVAGMSRWDALMDACHKRARPIVMTTIAMGAGMLPIAVGWGAADTSFRSPMAIAVIGGLITSTVLSLLVIPVVFTYLDDLGMWSKRAYRWAKDVLP